MRLPAAGTSLVLTSLLTMTTQFRSFRSRTALIVLASLAVLAGTHTGVAQEPTTTRIQQAEKEPQNWLTYYGNYAAWSYSPLRQVTRENVTQLVPAWAFAAGGPTNPLLRAGLEAAPLVVDGVLYLAGMQNNVYAVEAATGRRLWNYIYTWPQQGTTGGLGVRGLAAGDGLIFMGTQDARLVALDARTGKEVWNVAIDDVATCRCGITSAPLYLKGKVVTGIAGGDRPFRGYIKAVDAKTGKLLWTFYTIPAPASPIRTRGSVTRGRPAAWPRGCPDRTIRIST
jgi:alcohol dehydrogenase (cytochrome c)